ncbi:hypothetical protein HD806DRAFT_523280 [Xylariaceae sp. AK1471]|nr:hypothetical protein HD806DRAFT_523280 [Xylariaceae sp. AK1471]
MYRSGDDASGSITRGKKHSRKKKYEDNSSYVASESSRSTRGADTPSYTTDNSSFLSSRSSTSERQRSSHAPAPSDHLSSVQDKRGHSSYAANQRDYSLRPASSSTATKRGKETIRHTTHNSSSRDMDDLDSNLSGSTLYESNQEPNCRTSNHRSRVRVERIVSEDDDSTHDDNSTHDTARLATRFTRRDDQGADQHWELPTGILSNKITWDEKQSLTQSYEQALYGATGNVRTVIQMIVANKFKFGLWTNQIKVTFEITRIESSSPEAVPILSICLPRDYEGLYAMRTLKEMEDDGQNEDGVKDDGEYDKRLQLVTGRASNVFKSLARYYKENPELTKIGICIRVGNPEATNDICFHHLPTKKFLICH